LNRDYTQSNRWTKSCAIEFIGLQRISDFKIDLIAQLFNPDRLIREMAGWALYTIDPTGYHTNTRRLGVDNKRWLDRAIIPGTQLKLRLFEKIVFFQSLAIFENISGLALSFLSDISKEIRLAPEHTLSLDEKMNNDFFIVFKGLVQYYDRSQYVMDYKPGQFIGEIIAYAGFANSNLLLAKEDTILLKINKDEFYELLSDNVKLADKVLEYI
jgi:hypothetical protein